MLFRWPRPKPDQLPGRERAAVTRVMNRPDQPPVPSRPPAPPPVWWANCEVSCWCCGADPVAARVGLTPPPGAITGDATPADCQPSCPTRLPGESALKSNDAVPGPTEARAD